MTEIIGWREWLALPELGIPAIKAKIDTGARTSALHAYFVEPFKKGGVKMVRFGIHPVQNNTDMEIICEAEVKDERVVTDSGGHQEKRYVIESEIQFNGNAWPIELTLTNRDTMKFRMLLGRRALSGRYLVDSRQSFVGGRELKQAYSKEK